MDVFELKRRLDDAGVPPSTNDLDIEDLPLPNWAGALGTGRNEALSAGDLFQERNAACRLGQLGDVGGNGSCSDQVDIVGEDPSPRTPGPDRYSSPDQVESC
jgi:hypothetical protein